MSQFAFFSTDRSVRRLRGFTLIEILIVIAIIALLAAILFPVFGRARENARRSSCQSNMRQLGLGFLQYSQDFDEYMPRYVYGSCCSPNTQHLWYDAIYPYVKSVQVYNCPSAAYGTISQGTKKFVPVASTYTNGLTGVICLTTNTGGNDAMTAYAANRNYFTSYGVGGVRTPFHTSADQKIPALPVPDQTVFLTDYLSLGAATSNGSGLDGALLAPAPSRVYLHLEMSNVLFADGHVKAMNRDTLTATHKVGTADIAYLFTVQDD